VKLQTLAEANAEPHATPKHELATKLDRAIANKAARLLDVAKLKIWARAVKDRDEWKDRKTGQRVLSTRRLDPLRAEAHHIVSRDDYAVRYDVRNGVTLSLKTHVEVTMGRYRIEGTAWFTVAGCRYIDGTHAVIFVRT
jgi:hypothetical protein